VLAAVIADTHMPRGSRHLPGACIERLKAADLIVHAGDLTAASVLDELRGYGEVRAVHGNADDSTLRTMLPAQLELELDGVRVMVIHDAGLRDGRLARLRQRFPQSDAVIFGHSHLPLHERDRDGFQIFNPGSPTERRRAPHRTMGLARAESGRLKLELIELD
jgi:putative phosphoesterase